MQFVQTLNSLHKTVHILSFHASVHEYQSKMLINSLLTQFIEALCQHFIFLFVLGNSTKHNEQFAIGPF